MELRGLGIAQLLFVFVAASAVTVALYLLKQRRQSRRVPFLALWEQLLEDRRSAALADRLRHLLSLLLALLVVALLTLALGDPRDRVSAAAGRHLVLLVDAGVTMQATDVRPSRLAKAVEHARRLVRAAGPGLEMMVVQMDASATPLSPLGTEPRELERALDELRATDLVTDAQRAYRFALDVLAGQSGAEIVVVSDRASSPEPELARALASARVRLSRISVGARGDDLGISAFAVRRYPLDRNRGELLIEMWNATPEPREVELTLLGDGAPIDVQRVALPPGKSSRRVYEDVTAAQQTLEARLDTSDALAADDRAYATLPERRRTRVLCVSEGNRFLEAALLLDEYLDADVVAPASYTDAAGYDVVIFDRFAPEKRPETPALYLRPPPGGASPLRVEGEIDRPLFDRLERDHPLLRFVALRDVNVASALRVKPEPGDDIVAGDARGPLLLTGTRDGKRFIALTFDVRESDLPLRAAFPMLLLHGIDFLAGREGEETSGTEVGRTVELAAPPQATRAAVTAPDGTRQVLPVRDERVVLHPLRAGFYRVRAGDQDRVLAVNLAAATPHDIGPSAQLSLGAVPARAPELPSVPVRRPPFVLLLMAAALLLLLEWATYQRRYTV